MSENLDKRTISQVVGEDMPLNATGELRLKITEFSPFHYHSHFNTHGRLIYRVTRVGHPTMGGTIIDTYSKFPKTIGELKRYIIEINKSSPFWPKREIPTGKRVAA